MGKVRLPAMLTTEFSGEPGLKGSKLDSAGLLGPIDAQAIVGLGSIAAAFNGGIIGGWVSGTGMGALKGASLATFMFASTTLFSSWTDMNKTGKAVAITASAVGLLGTALLSKQARSK